MKLLVNSPIRHNGSFYPVGSFIDFKSEKDIPTSLVPLVETVSSSTEETAKPIHKVAASAKDKKIAASEKHVAVKKKVAEKKAAADKRKAARPPKGVAAKTEKKTVSKTKSKGE